MNTPDDGLFEEEEPGDGEFEITIEPRDEALEAAGISPDEFESALMDALEKHEEFAASYNGDDENFPGLEDTVLEIRGATYRLGDLAEIEVQDTSDDMD